MKEEPRSETRRTVLGASALGLLGATRSSSASLQDPPKSYTASANSINPVARVLPDRRALEVYSGAAIGTRVELSEPLRRGAFVARKRDEFPKQIEADRFQAFYIASTANENIVWVRDYIGPASFDWSGAKGDGVTDDAPYINAMLQNDAINWFQIEDGRRHRLGSSIRIDRPVKIVGAGVLNSVLSVDQPIDVIDVSMISAEAHGLHLADFGIESSMQPGSPTAGAGIRLHLAYLSRLSNIRVTNCYNGIHSIQSNLSNFDGIHINGFKFAGLLFDGGNNFDTRVSQFTISGHNIGTYAIRMVDMCDEMQFSDGVCSTSQFALYTDAAVYAVNRRPEFCRFSRVSFDSCVNGIDLCRCTDFVFDASFISCRPNHGAVIGIRGETENIQFTTTTFFNNGKCAAVIGAQSMDTDFIGCKFISNGTSKPNTYDTLSFLRGCGSFSLSSNRFRQGWDVESIPRYQVFIQKEGSGDYIMIGNQFSAAGSGVVRDERVGVGRILVGNTGIGSIRG